MPISRIHDPRIGCLAVPISAVAGFAVVVLVTAAIGVGAAISTVAGCVGALVGALVAGLVVRWTDPLRHPNAHVD